MSKTFASRPSVQSRATDTPSRTQNSPNTGAGATAGVSRGRGRGRSRGGTGVSAVTGRGGRTMQAPEAQTNPAGPTGSTKTEDRVQRRDAYTVIVPDEKKRQQIAQQAEKEEKAYAKHKANRKLDHFSYVGTVGGGLVSEHNVRSQQQQAHQSSVKPKTKSQQQWKQSFREKEQEEADRKKQEQRMKSLQNQERASARQRRLDEEMQTTKNKFLDRLEQQNRELRAKKILSSSAAAAATSEASAPVPAGVTASTSEGAVGGPSTNASYHPRPSYQDTQSPLDRLHQMFPDCDKNVIANILIDCNGDIDKARQLLS